MVAAKFCKKSMNIPVDGPNYAPVGASHSSVFIHPWRVLYDFVQAQGAGREGMPLPLRKPAQAKASPSGQPPARRGQGPRPCPLARGRNWFWSHTKNQPPKKFHRISKNKGHLFKERSQPAFAPEIRLKKPRSKSFCAARAKSPTLEDAAALKVVCRPLSKHRSTCITFLASHGVFVFWRRAKVNTFSRVVWGGRSSV